MSPLLAHTHHAACSMAPALWSVPGWAHLGSRFISPSPPIQGRAFRDGKWRGKWRIARLDDPAFPSHAHYQHTTHTHKRHPPPIAHARIPPQSEFGIQGRERGAWHGRTLRAIRMPPLLSLRRLHGAFCGRAGLQTAPHDRREPSRLALYVQSIFSLMASLLSVNAPLDVPMCPPCTADGACGTRTPTHTRNAPRTHTGISLAAFCGPSLWAAEQWVWGIGKRALWPFQNVQVVVSTTKIGRFTPGAVVAGACGDPKSGAAGRTLINRTFVCAAKVRPLPFTLYP